MPEGIRVNGEYYSWGDITVLLPNGPQVLAVSIDYSDAMVKEPVHGHGRAPRGYGKGQWSGEGTMTLKREGFDLLMVYALAAGIALYDLEFPITVTYANEGSGIRIDKLKGCTFTEASTSSAADAVTVEQELSFLIYEDIERDGVSAHGGNTI